LDKKPLHPPNPTRSWEIYASLGIQPGKPVRKRARNVTRLLKEKLIAKRRDGTL